MSESYATTKYLKKINKKKSFELSFFMFRICWNVELLAESPNGRQFRRIAAHDCKTIAAVSATANLREYLGYEIRNNNLIIKTNYTMQENQLYETNAYIELIAIQIPDIDNNTIRFKAFRFFNFNKYIF